MNIIQHISTRKATRIVIQTLPTDVQTDGDTGNHPALLSNVLAPLWFATGSMQQMTIYSRCGTLGGKAELNQQKES